MITTAKPAGDCDLCSRGIRVERNDRESQGATALRMDGASRKPDPLHLSAFGSGSGAGEGLIKSGCTAIAYEAVTDAHGGLPLLAPMSEVAGRLAIEAAGAALKRCAGGRGLLIGGVPGVPPARIVVIGGGVVGTHAPRMAAGLDAEVTILDRSIPRLRELDELFEERVRTRFSTIDAVEEEVFAGGSAVALARIIEPCRAVIALGPQLGVGDITRNRPTIGAVALVVELQILLDFVEGSRIFQGHDERLCREAGIDVLFAPEVRRVYPPQLDTFVGPGAPAQSLCRPFRPGDFELTGTLSSRKSALFASYLAAARLLREPAISGVPNQGATTVAKFIVGLGIRYSFFEGFSVVPLLPFFAPWGVAKCWMQRPLHFCALFLRRFARVCLAAKPALGPMSLPRSWRPPTEVRSRRTALDKSACKLFALRQRCGVRCGQQ